MTIFLGMTERFLTLESSPKYNEKEVPEVIIGDLFIF